MRLQVLSAIAVFAASLASADDITVDIRFSLGTSETTLANTVTGRDAVLYRVGAEAGQSMRVRLNSDNAATYFNLYQPGRGPGDEALAKGEFTAPVNDWAGTLPLSGDYTIAVFLYRAAARRGETSDFSLSVAIGGDTGAVVDGDFADGLAGGPDFFAVSVSGGDRLNIRAGPSAATGVVTRLTDGQRLRNLGCRMSEGQRWCRVATLADPGFEGWAAGRYLVEGGTVTTSRSGFALPAAPKAAYRRVQFKPGTSGAELSGTLPPGGSQNFLIGAASGQALGVNVVPAGQAISYQIFNPDSSFLLDQMSSDRPYRGELWQSGDHVVEVINRTDNQAEFRLIVSVE